MSPPPPPPLRSVGRGLFVYHMPWSLVQFSDFPKSFVLRNIIQRRRAWAAEGSPGESVAALNQLPWLTPILWGHRQFDTPFKFRQHQSCEVRSRLVELSVERTNRSFLSVWQRSTSWRYSLCMPKEKKSVARFSSGLACKAYERLFFTCRMQLRRKRL